MNDIGAYRPVILPSPRKLARMIAEQEARRVKELEQVCARQDAAIDDALFDEAIDRRIAEIAT